ncbi:response regulator [Stutzerimonas kirkiae]|uniref:ATP-binding response regulator n=1 Tax=Stutzerimonas kirkiae TaxID=2211392 RepID=UPI0010384BFE|nr:response regulator [Stutzerimonas kirkiae]TBV09844.1 hypothetical protein DNK01_18445 [Stutzerimonas kirkiae]
MLQEANYEGAFRASTHPCALLDTHLLVIDANPAYLALVGQSLPQIRGRALRDVLSAGALRCEPGRLAGLLASCERALAERMPDTSVGDGFSHVPIFDRHGRVETLLQTLDKHFIPSGKTLAGVAHELNNLLQVIGGNLQLLMRSLSADDSTRRRLSQAGSAVDAAADLLREVRQGVAQARAIAQPVCPADECGPLSSLRILFVEDDPTLRMLAGEVMTELGHEVCLSESAEEALEQLSRQPFDVLLTDVGLAGMSGLDLVREVRRQGQRLTLVIASGSLVDIDHEGLEGVRTMVKPYDIHQVRTLLDTIQAGA